jgi:sec-independent protein translocase protein TatA
MKKVKPMLNGFSYTEIILFGVIALMLFGSRLPDVARNFGRTYRDLRKKVDDFQREFKDWDKDPVPSKSNIRPTYFQDDQPSKNEPKAPKFIPPPPSDDD